VLDNYSPHLKEEVICCGLDAPGAAVFTPSNASWLNRIESQFTALREFALNNSDYRSHEEQIVAILTYLDWRNRRRGYHPGLEEYKRQQRVAAEENAKPPTRCGTRSAARGGCAHGPGAVGQLGGAAAAGAFTGLNSANISAPLAITTMAA